MKRITPLLFLSLACSVSDANATAFRMDTSVEVVATFNQMAGETPESVAVDRKGNKYISLALTGEIRKIDKDGNQSTFGLIPLGQCAPNPFPPIMGALALDIFRNVYVGASTCDPADRGIYRVSQSGDVKLIASLPQDALPNGVAVRRGRVYVADSAAPRVWMTKTTGDGEPAEVWTEDALLADPDPTDLAPGANGLQFFRGEMFVSNAGAASIVAIPMEGKQPGESYIKYGQPGSGAEIEFEFSGCDDFAFDRDGGLYCTTDPFQTVLRFDPESETVETVLDASNGLDGPTAAAFGRGRDRTSLYISNAAFPFFPGTGNGPSLLRITTDVAGYPWR